MFDEFVFSKRNIAAVLYCFSSEFAQPYFFFLALPISLVKALAREFFCKRWKCKCDCTSHVLTLFSFSLLNHAIFCFYPQCKPYHFSDKVLIIGDAAHAMVPFFGQGMNSVSSSMSFLIFVIMYDRYRTFAYFQMWC